MVPDRGEIDTGIVDYDHVPSSIEEAKIFDYRNAAINNTEVTVQV